MYLVQAIVQEVLITMIKWNVFLARDLKPMSLDKESVLKDAVRVYHPGEK